MTELDKSALIAFKRASEEKLKSKANSFALVALWLGVRIAVRSAPIKSSLQRLYSWSAEMTRGFANQTLSRLVYRSAASFFGFCVTVLSDVAMVRSRAILATRTSRAAVAPVETSVDHKALRKRALRITEAALWILAAGTLGYCGYAYASAAIHQSQRKAAFKALQAEADPVLASSPLQARMATSAPAPPVHGAVLGILDIPRIGLSSIVEQGVDLAVLRDSVGHIPGTAMPGQEGNVALAAHRDTYFRHLSELRSGDEIVFRSVSATYTYRVESTSVVPPADTSVLADTKKPTLTLVTCFPFYYVGSAPKRFVLVAAQGAVTTLSSSR